MFPANILLLRYSVSSWVKIPSLVGRAKSFDRFPNTRGFNTKLHDNDEEAYDGSGFGVAKGTVNTYIIDNMDVMTANEYQAALAAEDIERTRKGHYGLMGARWN